MIGRNMDAKKGTKCLSLLAVILLTTVLNGCSINTLVANALTGDGASAVFTGDSDPELVGAALPFAIKMYEALLYATPGHQGLMLTTGSLFVMYANAFVQGPAERLDPFYYADERHAALDRARNLYLRGHRILLDALERRHRGFASVAESFARDAEREGDMRRFLQRFRARDVPFLYWTVLSGLAAFSISPQDLELSRQLSNWHLMIERAFELDPDFGGASLDEFLVLYFASLPLLMGRDVERARFHFYRAMEKTGWTSTGALISYAASISIRQDEGVFDVDTFRERLDMVLGIDPDDNPATRLVTILDQRRARWMLDNIYELFPSFIMFPDG